MTTSLGVLCATAASIGLLHTVLGPDHYVPFVAMAKAGSWSFRKTLVITGLCGIGHFLGSIVLGFIGIALGIGVLKLEGIEASRGDLAGWLLLAFGLAYGAWGFRRAIRNKPHTHWHRHADGTVHAHEHVHEGEHVHVHEMAANRRTHAHSEAVATHESLSKVKPVSLTPWILFTIFVFGPCEPLIPILMYPAAEGSTWGVVLVATIFGATTIATMTAMVVAGYFGISRLRLPAIERYSHALAGFALFACGAAIKMGL
jgi:nickel/cobalt transporter (NicO) family protein